MDRLITRAHFSRVWRNKLKKTTKSFPDWRKRAELVDLCLPICSPVHILHVSGRRLFSRQNL